MFSKAKLLIVDDEEVICQACRRVFTPHGFEVETHRDAIEGLRVAAEEDFAAILLDIKMDGLDGIHFLEQLRKCKADVPVIFITGYPTVQNAAAALRLGAADYVTKPFTPEDILGAVQRSLGNGHTIKPERFAYAAQIFDSWVPSRQEFCFWGRAWLQTGQDGSTRVGAVLAQFPEKTIRSVQLPKIGETVYQGLPLAAARIGEDSPTIIPSPISGVVVAVNGEVAQTPALLSKEPCGHGWLASVCPTRFEEEGSNCTVRRVFLLSSNEATAAAQNKRLSSLGCDVIHVTGWRDLAPRLIEGRGAVLIVDAASFGKHGPELVGRINTACPEMRIVVVASPESRWEAAYRARRILYYAVTPFADNEIVDIVDAAFAPRAPRPASRSRSGAAYTSIMRISITNGAGRKIRLLSPRGLLCKERGLGWHITQRLRDHLCSVEVGTGPRTGLCPVTILEAAHSCDRLLILLAKDMGRLPGTMVRDTLGEFTSALCEHTGSVTALVVQPAARDNDTLEFDERTTEALAEHIVHEMALFHESVPGLPVAS